MAESQFGNDQSADAINDVRREREDLARVLKKHIGIRKIVEDLYPDSAHFIYELLQNAEDTDATEARFTLNGNELVFEHNGRPFELRDIYAITDIGEGTKAGDEDKIGRFGVGFKAVFAYSETPHIWSPTFSFKITDLVLPSGLKPASDLAGRTRFRFPFNNPKKPADVAFREVVAGLKGLDEKMLLFLTHLRSISWQVDTNKVCKLERVNHSENHIKLCRYAHKDLTGSHYLKFEQPVHPLIKQKVAIAYELEFLPKADVSFDPDRPLAKQMKLRPAKPGRVAVFFPAEKEVSGLRFHLHAPFVPELSRASIKDTPANDPLFRQLAELSAASLHEIRDLGLLNTEFLEVLPNDHDEIEQRYEIIRSAIFDEMNDKPLTPTQSRTHAPAKQLVQGKASLKSLLSDVDLEFLLDYQGKPFQWAANVPQKNSDADRFMESLAIGRWDVDDFVTLLCNKVSYQVRTGPPHNITPAEVGEWLCAKSAEWHQELYALLLNDHLATAGFRRDSFSKQLGLLNIVRLTDGTYGMAGDCFFNLEGGQHDEALKQADVAVYASGRSKSQQDNARAFLAEIGVRDLGEAEYVETILKQRYTEQAEIPDSETYQKDFARFVDLVEKDPKTAHFFADYFIFKSQQDVWRTPDTVYLDQPFLHTGLSVYYTPLGDDADRFPLDSSYETCGISRPRLAKFAQAVGATITIEIEQVSCNGNPDAMQLVRFAPGNWTRYGIDEDYRIPRLDTLLRSPNVILSQLIWKTLCEQTNISWATARYRNNSSYPVQTAPSHLVCVLRDHAWIPQSDGRFVRPSEATREALPAGFAFDPGWKWLTAIEFGKLQNQQSSAHRERVSAAQQVGLPEELIPDLLELTPEQIRSVFQIGYAQVRATQLPEFPEQKAKNPERRAAKLRDRLETSPPKTREVRERTVRTSDPASRADAKTYLRDLYTNADKIMVCQACHYPMPFKLPSGEYYFEAVALFGDLEHEYRENYLAFCPVCAAKFRHASEIDPDEFRDTLQSTEDLRVEVSLAGESHQIRFVDDHRTDLLAVTEVEANRSAGLEITAEG